MKRKQLYQCGLALALLMSLLGCKSEFEAVRTSTDPKLQYQKAMAYYDEKEYQKAQTLLELLVSSVRGTKEAEGVYFKYAYTYYYLENYLLASYYFTNFVNTFGGSALREEAEFMSAYSQYKLSPTFRLDQSYSDKAIADLEGFVNAYPESPRVKECNQLIDELRVKLERKTFESAKLYFNLRYYQSAIRAYENLLKDFPETANAEEVRFMIIRSSFLLAENSILDKREERFKACLKLTEEFLERYPKSANLNEVKAYQVDANRQIKIISNNVGYQNQSTRSGS